MELNFQKRLFLSNGERILSFDSGHLSALFGPSKFSGIRRFGAEVGNSSLLSVRCQRKARFQLMTTLFIANHNPVSNMSENTICKSKKYTGARGAKLGCIKRVYNPIYRGNN
uniref:Uncharacterized protein n=1 Tax=Solanum lycopersicum TaxID=4081 RepID=A0A3Q7EBB8_SOLLC